MSEQKRTDHVDTRSELSAVLRAITMENTTLFNAKWNFLVTPCGDPDCPATYGWFLQLAFERPDTETGQVGRGLGRMEFVQRGTNVSGVVKTCWLLMELLLRHELMEAFRFQGCRVFNPHHSIEELQNLEKERSGGEKTKVPAGQAVAGGPQGP